MQMVRWYGGTVLDENKVATTTDMDWATFLFGFQAG